MKIQNLLSNINYSNFIYRIEKLKAHGVGESPLFIGTELRGLNNAEIHRLEKQGNICTNWDLIRVVTDFTCGQLWANMFIGSVVLGNFSGRTSGASAESTSGTSAESTSGASADNILIDEESGTSYPRGIFRSTIENSHIGSDCAIHSCPGISRTLVVRNSLLANSSTSTALDTAGGVFYGNGTEIPVGVETGGREIALYADLSLELAEYLLRNPGINKIRKHYALHLREYLEKIRFSWTIVDKHSKVLDTGHIHNSYLGPYSRLDAADEIRNSCIFSTAEDPSRVTNSSVVRNSIIQDGVHITDAAIIQNSMLFEHSHAEHHGKIVDSIIGPNSGVSKGEITSCFLGPFVGFHHQSLLIAAFWPGGRGNVGYGANIGSNHTSRMPDQECWSGEGMFFGLGCAVKYPANFMEAPYSIIAAGVKTLPQKLRFPFSLINEPEGYYQEVPPGYNNLIPAWGLSSNLYALKRNESKYRERNRAHRNIFDFRLFKDEILDYMRNALELLKNIDEPKTIYLPDDIPGTGTNMLTEENRIRAIDAYEFFLRFARYEKLKRQLDQQNAGELLSGCENKEEVTGSLRAYMDMLPEIIRRTESSRSRDIRRGEAIIPDYRLTHPSVEEDKFVQQVREEIGRELRETEALLANLSRL